MSPLPGLEGCEGGVGRRGVTVGANIADSYDRTFHWSIAIHANTTLICGPGRADLASSAKRSGADGQGDAEPEAAPAGRHDGSILPFKILIDVLKRFYAVKCVHIGRSFLILKIMICYLRS